ncbi:DUF1043 family protein [Halomonas sp. TRM85114]|uniref:YhcB family protein n=1 Tax=Halomonas jincaotanensis TaxID=2810616 RepID=UPI001BD4738D|nr:DUF1043 family protein [Halomonas jincaotanensis]MBS9402074.1 DUF1043 family protein [Halomonas jincaotanensis]
MDESNINWALTIAVLLAGIGIGAMSHHLLNARAGQVRTLRRKIAERDRELSVLKSGVDTHFTELTELAENLRRDSETLMQRLEKGTETLNSLPHRTSALSVPPAEVERDTTNERPATTPRDYADGNGGTLSEDFGLKSRDVALQPPRY